ncbi:unnamed protein product [Cyclocybe aegerita]|uniref:Uncharacterized protein n=1 Tax=Cyclocybe aegerita TaxID=1973307 RepID=A0A8S0XNU6_CYCAE|nr:unnamed protein product [Cyclocybe aegerita]
MSAPSVHSRSHTGGSARSSARSSQVSLGSVEQDLVHLRGLLDDSLERSRQLQASLEKNRTCLDQSLEESRLLRQSLEESTARLEESMRRRGVSRERRGRQRERRPRDSLSPRESEERPRDESRGARVEEASESRESSVLSYVDEPERELPPLPIPEEPTRLRPILEEETFGGLLRRLIQVNHENNRHMILALDNTYRGMMAVKHRHALDMIVAARRGRRPAQPA